MSGSQLAALLGGEGLVRNRNDPRYHMAQRLLKYQAPDQIHGKGATIMSALAGAATGVANAFTLSRADAAASEERAAAKAQQDQWRQQFQDVMGGGQDMPAAAPAPAPMQDSGPAAMMPQQAPGVGAAPRPAGGGAIIPPAEYQPLIMAASQRTGVPPHILAAQLDKESGFNSGAVGGVGELGAAQIRPSTAQQPGYGVAPMSPADARDPAKAINFQADYLVGKGKANGVTDWTNPDQQRRGIALYNGAGPQADAYAQDVLARAGRVQLASADGQGARELMVRADGTAGPQPQQIAMAAQLRGPGAQPASPQQQRMADMLTPEGVQRLQRGATAMYAAGNPMAPVVQRQADQAEAQLFRQQDNATAMGFRREQAAQHQADEQRRETQRQQERADAQRRADDGRLPQGQRWNADRTAAEDIPGVRRAEPAPRNVQTLSTADGVFVVNPDGTLGNRLGGLPRQAEADKPARMAGDAVVKGITGNIATLRQLDQAIEAATANPAAFGADQAIPFVSRFGPQASVDARGQVANIGSLKMHDRSGANVTASEAPRLIPFIPQTSDPPESVRTKLQGMRRIIAEQLEDQYSVYGPENGYKPVPGHARALGRETDAPVAGAAPAARGVAAGPGEVVRPAETSVPSPFAAPGGASGDPLPMPLSERGLPDMAKMQDGQRFKLPNGTVLRFNGARGTFSPE